MRFRLGGFRLVLQLPGRLFQKLAIHLVTNGRDMSALLGAKDVARSANFQIAHRDLEPRPQMAVFLDRLQPLGRHRRHRPVRRQQQITIRPILIPPHSSAKLMQLAEPKPIRLVDENRVGVGNIQSAFDDRRADQNVRLMPDEFQHHVFQLALGHLAVADDDPRIGHQLEDFIRHFRDVVNPVVDEIDLPLAIQLAHDRLLESAVCRTAITSVTMLRRSCGAVVSELISRSPSMLMCSVRGNRRGRHRQHIHRAPHLLQSLFMRDAEALLLVDHDQTQIG